MRATTPVGRTPSWVLHLRRLRRSSSDSPELAKRLGGLLVHNNCDADEFSGLLRTVQASGQHARRRPSLAHLDQSRRRICNFNPTNASSNLAKQLLICDRATISIYSSSRACAGQRRGYASVCKRGGPFRARRPGDRRPRRHGQSHAGGFRVSRRRGQRAVGFRPRRQWPVCLPAGWKFMPGRRCCRRLCIRQVRWRSATRFSSRKWEPRPLQRPTGLTG